MVDNISSKLLRIPRVKTSGRPGTRPLEVLEDAAYDYVDIRKYLMFRVLG
jgi:hypothetical protein